MEPRPNALFTAALAAASATAARIAILARNGTMPGYCGLPLKGTNNSLAPWLAAQFNGLGRVKLISTGSTTPKHDREARSWKISFSGSYASSWFFAQTPEPEDEAQDEPEDEKPDEAEPQRQPAPAVRKQSSTEDNASLLRDGGTINPPFP